LFGCGHTPDIPHSDYLVTAGTYPSAAMHGDVPWVVALPRPARAVPGPPRPRLPLVVVLPGAGGTASDLVDRIGLPGWATAGHLPLAFACPGGGGSTYYHPRSDGSNSFAWVTDEFLPMVEQRFPVGGTRRRRAAYGYSMGGFGALLIASKRPDLFCAVAASSPAVFPTYDAAVTGHPETFDSNRDWRRWGLWEHLGGLERMPVRIDCGDADPFASTAHQLLDRIPNATGGISQGCHDQAFWRRGAPAQLQFLAHHLPA
jgi:S-formylglutathione hydrolase FrmB